MHSDAPTLRAGVRDPQLGKSLGAGLRVASTLNTDFCLEAAYEVITRDDTRVIFDTGHGCQLTTEAFTELLNDRRIQIGMSETVCRRDDVFVERLCEVSDTKGFVSMPTSSFSICKRRRAI